VDKVMHYGISASLLFQSVFSQLGCGSSRDSDVNFGFVVCVTDYFLILAGIYNYFLLFPVFLFPRSLMQMFAYTEI